MRVYPDSADDNPLKVYFKNNKGLKLQKWHHYFDVYHNHFRRFRDNKVRILEIGVNRGGSLHMWKDYFGPRAEIYGIDNNPRCKMFDDNQIKVIIGDQGNRDFLRSLYKTIGEVDILIDDGGHRMVQQILTFDILYRLVAPNGIYVVEDMHTSYWPELAGGRGRPGTFMEKAKNLVDSLNGWHSVSPDFSADDVTRTATGLHFYDSMMVIEKCPNPDRPIATATGVDPFVQKENA